MLCDDGIIGINSWRKILDTLEPEKKSEAWNCPHCGGTQTETKNDKTICAYCKSEIVGVRR